MFSAPVIYPQQPGDRSSSTALTAEQNAVLNEARQLSQRVVQLHGSKKFDEALPLARRALELRQSVFGDNHPLVADALANLAGLHFAKREFERAESFFKQALSSYDNAKLVSQQSADVLQMLMFLRWEDRDYDKAEVYGKRAIEANEKLYGVNSFQLLNGLLNLIQVYQSKGDIGKTDPLFERVVSLAERNKEKLSSQLAQALALYRCSHLDSNLTTSFVEVDRRIEELLRPQSPTQQEPLPGGLLNGRALSLPKPPYPEWARSNRASGTVVVKVEIDECGRVTKAEAVSGASELKPVSVNAAMKARFSPTLLSGVPVKVTGVIQYNFVAQHLIR
jgi:TonB family protein